MHGSAQVERHFSKSCEWVSRGAIAPDLPEGIDGCRESEVSRECLTDDTVCWLYNGFDTREEPWPEGCNGSAQRAPLPRCGVLHRTSCARAYVIIHVIVGEPSEFPLG